MASATSRKKAEDNSHRENSGRDNANRPVHEIRLGRIKAAIWENETQSGVRHSITIQRLYVDDHEKWQTSTSFGRDDLPLVMKVADMTHSWIYQQGIQQGNENSKERAA